MTKALNTEPDVKLAYYQGTASNYPGYDRFGRIKDQFWDGYGSTADVDRFKYAYDYNGNRTYRNIDSSIYATNNKDQAYTYDGLDRLKTFDEGTLSGSTITGTPTKEEDWTLDALGNWPGYVMKTAGSTDLNQSRTNNAVNETTDITESVGTSWVTPAYDTAGNMTTIPKPATLSSGFSATYDAWNRLVKIVDGANTVAEYEYDGLNRRIVKSIYASGSLDHRQHSYLSEKWQEIEVRKEVSGTEDADPLQQYVWHPYYIDALALRDYDPETDGSATRYYYTHDANFNVTAVTNSTGTAQERYQYTAYGHVEILDAGFAADVDGQSDIANSVSFTGSRHDAETGLFYFRNRVYDSNTGQFITRDPIGYANGYNLYAAYFVPNRTDAHGLWCDDLCTTQGEKQNVKLVNIGLDAALKITNECNVDSAMDIFAATSTLADLVDLANAGTGLIGGLKGLAEALPDIAYSQGTSGHLQDLDDALGNVVDVFRKKLKKLEGVAIYTKWEYEECDKEGCCLFWKRLNWSPKIRCLRCSQTGKDREIGFDDGDLAGIKNAIDNCVKEAKRFFR